MRKLLFVAVLFAVCCLISITTSSCRDKGPAQDSLATDSSVLDSDTVTALDSIIAETEMPAAADELFDDFIFNFGANKKLQFERINFPLPVTTGSKTSQLDKNQWKMEHFFLHQDFYTLILDNMKQLNATKDTAVSHVVIEKIFLGKNAITQYVFNRERGLWKMTGMNKTTISASPNASFLKFYNNFANDTAFQIKSISDPMTFVGPDPDDDFSTLEGSLVPDQWPSFAPPFLPSGTIYNIIYGDRAKASSQKVFVIRGIANGFETTLTFKLKEGKWFLTKMTT